jgi:hypothetical protein
MHTHTTLASALALALIGCGGVPVGTVEPWWPSTAQQEPQLQRLILVPTQAATLRRWPQPAARDQDATLSVGRQGDEISRALLRFDLGALPPGARVHAARLWVTTHTLCPDAPPLDEGLWLRASPLARPWRPDALRWEDTPPTLDALAAPTLAQRQPGGADQFDLTQAVRAWSAGQISNHGVELRALHEGQRFCKSYHAIKNGTVSQAPRLHIEYSVPAL